MTKQEILQTAKGIIAEKLNIEEEEVKLESSFIDDLGADSLDLVDLVMAFEDEFGVKVEDEDVEKLRTVKDVVEYIYKKLGNADSDDEDDEEIIEEDYQEEEREETLDEEF